MNRFITALLISAFCSIWNFGGPIQPKEYTPSKSAIQSLAEAPGTYDIGKGNVVIGASGNYKITGSTKRYTVTVKNKVSANITLEDVAISGNSSPIRILSGGTANIILKGQNIVTCTKAGAAIHVPEGATFILSDKSTGSLTATGGRGGSGIGGNCIYGENEGTGSIHIRGGHITAIGGSLGCGIGGGISERYWDYYSEYDSGSGSILISGGTVTAIGGEYSAAGIGGSNKIRRGRITISGGIVNASSFGAGIGGESRSGKGNIITITGGTVTATGSSYAPGIGNSMVPADTQVTVSGGMITARGGLKNRVLDEYVFMKESEESLKTYDIAAAKIVISGGNLNAYTLSSQPLNSDGKKVYHALFNCRKAEISSITVGKTVYGAKDVISYGYLSLYIPDSKASLLIKSGSDTLLKYNIYAGETSLIRNATLHNNSGMDIGEGAIEIIPEGVIYMDRVYRVRTWETGYSIAGRTKEHEIVVHSGEYIWDPSILIKDISADYEDGRDLRFITIESGVSVTLQLKGESSVNLRRKNLGISIGSESVLHITGETQSDKLILTAGEETDAIFTNYGDIRICGGSLEVHTGKGSAAIMLGNHGILSMYGGRFTSTGDEGMGVTGSNHLRVNIHGGSILTQMIGYYENGNEEISNDTELVVTGGSIESTGRMIFGKFLIYGGDVDARIFGCGTGCSITMYSGTLDAGATAERILNDGGSTGSNFMWFLYGGKVTIRKDVPQKELDDIITEAG